MSSDVTKPQGPSLRDGISAFPCDCVGSRPSSVVLCRFDASAWLSNRPRASDAPGTAPGIVHSRLRVIAGADASMDVDFLVDAGVRVAGPSVIGASRSSQRQIFRAAFAPHPVELDLERNLLAFGETRKTRPFDRTDMDEHVIAAVIGLDESEALLTIEPLDCTRRHFPLQSA